MTSQGINPEGNNTTPPTPPEWDRLLIACQKNQISVVKDLLEHQGVDPNHANTFSQSALHIAAWWGHADCVELLLQHGANVHAANELTGATPLHCIVQSSQAALKKSQRLACLDALLEHGANPDQLDSLGRTPLMYLDEDDIDRKIMESKLEEATMVKTQALKPEIFGILEHQSLDELDDFLSRRGEEEEETIKATFQERTPLLQIIQEWCDVQDDDNQGLSTAWYAPAVRRILDHGADTTGTNEDGHSAADLLCESIMQRFKQTKSLKDDDEGLQAFVQTMNVMFKVDGGEVASSAIPLGTARDVWLDIARRNYMDLAKLWQTWGISPVGVVNRQGMTPLQFAARSGHAAMVEFLVEHCTINKGDKDWLEYTDNLGKTALDAARANQKEDIVAYLEQKLK